MKKFVCFILSCMFVMAFTSQAYAIQNNTQIVELTQQNPLTLNNSGEEIIHNVFVDKHPVFDTSVFLMARVYVQDDTITKVVLYIEIPRNIYGLRYTGGLYNVTIAEDGKSFTAIEDGYVTSNNGPSLPIHMSGTVNLSDIR